MTKGQVEAFFAKLTYKPGYTFEVYWGIPRSTVGECFLLSLTSNQIDVRDQTNTRKILVTSTMRFDMPAVQDSGEKYLLELVKACVRKYEHHEIDEWLQFDGQQLTKPHE